MFSYSIVNNIIIFNFIGNITISNFKQYCETINNIYSMKKDMYLIYNLKKASIPLHLLPNQVNHMIKCKEDTLKYVKASSIIVNNKVYYLISLLFLIIKPKHPNKITKSFKKAFKFINRFLKN